MRFFCFVLLLSNYVISQNGSVITWGNSSYGGDSSNVSSLLNSEVTKIFSTVSAFAALKNDGSVVTWGDSSYGGNSGDDATFFEIDDSDQSGSAQSIFIDFKSAYQGNLTHSNPQDFNGDNIYSFILSVSDVQSNTSSVVINFEAIDNNSPTVTLTDSDSDNLVSPTEVVTITATFSESMTATPTISLSGIVSNSEMSATNSATIWTYTWTVSDSVSSTTATVSGTDLSGNAYMGGDSLSFNVNDIIPFTLVKQGSFLKIVKNNSG